MEVDYQKEYIQNKSYWELSRWTGDYDFVVVGAGFTGLYTALAIVQKAPSARVAVLEKANRYGGASTRNAGFVCFGSPSEIMADVDSMGREATIQLLHDRYQGMRRLKEVLPAREVDLKWTGGIEALSEEADPDRIPLIEVNDIIEAATGLPAAYQKYPASQFGVQSVSQVFYTEFEGVMDPAKAVNYLSDRCTSKGVEIIRGCEVLKLDPGSPHLIATSIGTFRSERVAICTNAYMGDLIEGADVRPAKNQVYVTSPVKHQLMSSCHMNAGFVYFRPVGDRILIGGARHLENEDEPLLCYNAEIEAFLEAVVKRYVCPGQSLAFDYRWIGHIGVGAEKAPIVRTLENGMVSGGRLSGMGVALASALAEKIAEELFKSKETI